MGRELGEGGGGVSWEVNMFSHYMYLYLHTETEYHIFNMNVPSYLKYKMKYLVSVYNVTNNL